jgi:AraC-like DNA-binding protein
MEAFDNRSMHLAEKRTDLALAYCRHLKRARSYVEQHELGSVKLNDVANAIGISPSRLAHLFREKTGLTFSEWVTGNQIRKAIILMHEQDILVSELADRTGFSSYRTFQRSFKRLTGLTPAQYKKRLQAQFLA